MDNARRLSVYQAQCQNVRSLSRARRQLKRTINRALLNNNAPLIESLTRSLALVFSAWVEASFSKLIHTPHGLTLDEIAQVKRVVAERDVVRGWEKCIELALRKNNAKKSGFGANARQKLNRLVDEFVSDPSLVRNKIAHGQWSIALNRNNTDINVEMTNKIDSIDFVKIEYWFDCISRLESVVEHLVESPNKAFMDSYWRLVSEVDEIKESRAGWSLESKRESLAARRELRM